MLVDELKTAAVATMRRNLQGIVKCVNLLDEGELWKDFNGNLVSIGNLLLHLSGNISQYILSGLGGESCTRQRAREFSDKPQLGKAELLDRFTQIIDQALRVVEALPSESLTRISIIQGAERSGARALFSAVEHLSYHTGQITFAVKHLKDVDVGYFAGVDLNQQNRPTAVQP
jgi:uncharacterized damage-inducible protein DinB